MKKFVFILLGLINVTFTKAQVLIVPEVIQEQNQWCWSGVSKSILDYYGYNNLQCEIAEYARTVITWTSFGTTDCCVDPTLGCNYWNYLWGADGSIEDILIHFGSIPTTAVGAAIPLSQVNTEIASNQPFIVRWGWNTGGGHFVLGHGVSGNDVYYMNPWFGEGLHVSTYSWLVYDTIHTWTHTLLLNSAPTAVNEISQVNTNATIYPNPSAGNVWVNTSEDGEALNEIAIYNQLGEMVYFKDLKYSSDASVLLNLNSLSKGIYSVQIKAKQSSRFAKLCLQ